ncbi:dynein assembly factor 3, axonemal [Eurytemora carolleeae]|uniref:dynein assembly factor 3, axonemal n=1 Tax=Eurytemora carolleeae TaxID=1294199 RepID=UPI000C78C65B|nr:dynein assembly factor 3, axonemal [Eurytemora carolleeae]|eukprot:XP_023341971.1 dynein assembly factor 3, axonemal-like [Eurytemora affinis]
MFSLMHRIGWSNIGNAPPPHSISDKIGPIGIGLKEMSSVQKMEYPVCWTDRPRQNLELGLGEITWWGFSSWIELGPAGCLVAGGGDPRHILYTLAHNTNVKIYLLEQKLEVYAKQILLVYLILSDELEITEKVWIYLDIYANSIVSQKTAQYIRKTSKLLAKKIGSRESVLPFRKLETANICFL